MAKPHKSVHSRLKGYQTLFDLERELATIEDETIAQIQEDLRQAREETIARLARITGTWDIAQAQQIIAELERQQNQYSVVWTDLFKSALEEALSGSEEAVYQTLKSAGIEISVKPFISTQFFEIAVQTMPTLIKGLTDEWIANVSRILRQSVLAQLTPLDVIRQLGELPPFARFDVRTGKFIPLTDAEIRKALETNGPYAKLFRRLESIARTEIGRIAQTSNYLTLRELAKGDPRYRKEWSAVIDSRTRPSHVRANGQRQKVDEPFIVGGEPMQFPHDPRASAAETVNCRCMIVPWHPAFDDPSQASLPTDGGDRGHTPTLPTAA